MPNTLDSFKTRSTLKVGSRSFEFFSLKRLEEREKGNLSRLPVSIKIFLENLLRHEDGKFVRAEDIQAVMMAGGKCSEKEVFFMPARVLMQDFTGVPAIVDLAAMRDAMKTLGGDPKKINPLQPVDLVVDHSVQVDRYGNAEAFAYNSHQEFERNVERYAFLKWGQQAFRNFRAVPPETGIVHQVNLEYFATVVFARQQEGKMWAYPDTLVGTDSHTTMINGLGVLGWGVGGIEAEAVMLGQPIAMLIPEVLGFKLTGALKEGVTATDAVLTVTEILRKKGVVGKFAEFYGPGLSALSLADRATISNMCPEYGATVGLFPVDEKTLEYLRMTGRPEETVQLVEAYCKEQGLFRTPDTSDPVFPQGVELDLSAIQPCLAGPTRPQDKVLLKDSKASWKKSLPALLMNKGKQSDPQAVAEVSWGGENFSLTHGSVVISAITSCTNTSNPTVMIGAGLLAKKAVEKGLQTRPWVKTSLAPGSKVVMDYLKDSGLLPYLEKLRFHLVGFGCTTCIGNSGPLADPIADAITQKGLAAAAVLSGNRNFEGRINPHVKAAYLTSPPLVVAYALVGHMDIDLLKEPLGKGKDGKAVYLKDIWPSNEEVQNMVSRCVRGNMFQKQYANVFEGDANWKSMKVAMDELFRWDPASTYVRRPPYFENMEKEPSHPSDIRGARVLAVLGDSVTTDHISPAGNIAKESSAAKYLMEHGVSPKHFNSYGSRRGNHEVMVRGTFGNIRIKNLLAPGTEGGVTLHLPDEKITSIYEASVQYAQEGVPLVVLAGKEYGSGSSRDWAAKGPALLGVRAVIAESYERIHRSNLLGMGILPLQFKPGENRDTLGLTGHEMYEVSGIAQDLKPKKEVLVRADVEDKTKEFKAIVRIDTPIEVEYYRHGGILPYVLRQLL
ncbi:MAG: aconitate hydratase AcnA [Elusimicrobia bacterium]|nr:aconitate hydratase AcnA [Elusimicrobiota bacterium]